jgi:hypothetical protein
MSKPIRFILPLLFSVFSLLFFACGKEETPPTVINGKVTDKKTGEPIEGAEINIDFRYKGKDGAEIHEVKTFFTDAQGEFHRTQDSDYEGSYSEVRKSGYATQISLKFKRGEENNIDVKLAPIDGTLRLEVSNQTGQFSSIYVIVENPSFIAGGGSLGKIFADSFPINLLVGEGYIEYFNLPSEEFTKVHWGFSYFTSLSASPFRDSIFLTLNDTTNFLLSY